MNDVSRYVVLALVLTLAAGVVAGCSGTSAEKSGTATSAPAAQATSERSVTIPASYFTTAVSADEAMAQLRAAGCSDIVDNGDGSFTANMDADSYNQMVADLYGRAVQAVETVQDGTTYPNVESVSYDEGFTTVQVKLNTDVPGLEDTYALAAVGVPAVTYQQVAGLPVGCSVDLVLGDGTVQQTSTFPL